jgi:hypothetical protein
MPSNLTLSSHVSLFNVFINDIFLFIKDSSLYNYADDNTLSFVSPDFDLLISTLESDSNHLIERLYLYVCQNLIDNRSQCQVI